MKSSCKLTSSIVLSLSIFLLTITSCVSAPDPISFEREEGYYYGEGQGSTLEDAEIDAKIDLISSALEVLITAEMAESYTIKGLKPYITETRSGVVLVVYRYSMSNWEKVLKAKEETLRAELIADFESAKQLGRNDLVAGLNAATALLERLSKEGMSQVLTQTEEDTTLLNDVIEEYSRKLVSKMQFALAGDGVFLNDDSVISITLKTNNGKPVPAMPVAISWASGEYRSEIETVTTNDNGEISIPFPKAKELKNRAVEMSLKILLSNNEENTEDTYYLKSVERASFTKIQLYHFEDIKSYFSNDVKIPGGTFFAGALKHDKRAESKEKPRKVKVSDFYMDKYPVTNGMYKVFLNDMKVSKANWPEYLDNESFNMDDQPIIGVSMANIKEYITWLEERVGIKKRLPTEDEWEKAAHGGNNGIYPWGDKKPEDGEFANFNGEDEFDGTSPVGSFTDGENDYGLFDMSGNVWEWTSSVENNKQEGRLTVKGGSWMDGQYELRVSTRRYLDPSQGYSDVGFRLVREVSNE